MTRVRYVPRADQVLRAAARGRPSCPAQLFQVIPALDLTGPMQTAFSGGDDLKGKRIGVTFGGNDEAILRGYLARLTVSPKTRDPFSACRYDICRFMRGGWTCAALSQRTRPSSSVKSLKKPGNLCLLSPDQLGVCGSLPIWW